MEDKLRENEKRKLNARVYNLLLRKEVILSTTDCKLKIQII